MSNPTEPPIHRVSSTVRFARPGLEPIDTTTPSESSEMGDGASRQSLGNHTDADPDAHDEQELFRGGEGMMMEPSYTNAGPGAGYGALQAGDPRDQPAGAHPAGMPQAQRVYESGYDSPAQAPSTGYQQPGQPFTQSPAVMTVNGSEYQQAPGQGYAPPGSLPLPSTMYHHPGISPGNGSIQSASPASTLINQYPTPSPLSLPQNVMNNVGQYVLANPGYPQPLVGPNGYPIYAAVEPQGGPQGYRQYDGTDVAQHGIPQGPWHPGGQPPMPPPQNWSGTHLFADQGMEDPRRSSDATLIAPEPEKKYPEDDIGTQDPYTSARRPQFSGGRARGHSDASETEMRRRGTREMEKMEKAYVREEPYVVKGGVFSQLLRLTGRSATLRKRQTSKAGGTGMDSRATSVAGGDLPTMQSLGLKRRGSEATTAGGEAEEFDDLDPRVTGQKKKVVSRRMSLSDLVFRRNDDDADGRVGNKYRRRASVQYHVADILTRHTFILKLAKALMIFGAPSHRIESQLAATALVLEVDAQFLHLPSIVLASFGDIDTRTSEMHFVKAQGALDLGKLHKVHSIYKAVVHDEYDAAEGTKRIQALLKSPLIYNVWIRIFMAFFSSGLVCPMAYGGSFIDGLASGTLGVLLAFLQLQVASKNAMYSNIFEISTATFISFAARGLSVTGIFCYQAIVSAGVTLILPGYTILCGSLELASKNVVAGSVRMVYAIIYSLFLGFGITIGSDLFYVMDRPARNAANAASAAASTYLSLSGTFLPGQILVNNLNSTFADATSFLPFNGTFTFSNATTDAASAAYQSGSVICPRAPGLPWYRQAMPRAYLIPIVPIFSVLIALWNFQPLRSRQLPVMVVISCTGYITNQIANRYIFDRSDVVTAIGAFVIGVLGNVYSRVFGGTAFTSMVPGVLFLTPSGIAAAGGLAMTTAQSHSDSYNQGLTIGFRMVQVAIGITVGLFGSGLLIYSFGRKKGSALFAF